MRAKNFGQLHPFHLDPSTVDVKTASIPLFASALAIDIWVGPTRGVAQLYSECLCWALIWLAATTFARCTRQDQEKARGAEPPSNSLCWAILVTTACQMLDNVIWTLPLLTPALLFLTTRSGERDPGRDVEKAPQGDGPYSRSSAKRIGLVLLAILSACALSLRSPNLYSLAVGSSAFLSQASVYFLMLPNQSRSAPQLTATVSLLPTASRVVVGLFVMIILTPPYLPSLGLLSFVAVLKAIRWMTLVVLCRTASVTDISAIATYSGATSLAYQMPNAQGVGATLTALVALAQSHRLLPESLYRSWIAGAFATITVMSMLLPHRHAVYGLLGEKWAFAVAGNPAPYTSHPIMTMAIAAQERYTDMVERQSKTLSEATAEYERRYARAPPPGFETWYELAVASQVVLIDEYDDMMHALEPFWGLSPREIRHRAKMAIETDEMVHGITIRNHVLGGSLWALGIDMQMFKRLSPFAEFLPDLDIPLNQYDEPRVVVPHDELSGLLSSCPSGASGSMRSDEPQDLGHESTKYIDLGGQRTWEAVTQSCPPESASASHSPRPYLPTNMSFIQNASASKELCDEPAYADQHGLFLAPSNLKIATSLVPIFGKGKPSSFQDLSFPSGAYNVDHDEEAGQIADVPWSEKDNELYWAGSTTGGRGKKDGLWRRMHRQRFVRLVNDRTAPIELLEQGHAHQAGTWVAHQTTMDSVADLFNVSFTAIIQCDEDVCDAEKAELRVTAMSHTYTAHRARYVFDLDGNGWSGRFYRLLRSRSTVLKQTLLKEWHDDWLIPWVHYVPVSLHMRELPETMHFLARTIEGQRLSEEIAEQGRQWAERCLRDIDMDLYTFRSMLEYARLVDDERAPLARCSS